MNVPYFIMLLCRRIHVLSCKCAQGVKIFDEKKTTKSASIAALLLITARILICARLSIKDIRSRSRASTLKRFNFRLTF